MQLNQAELTVCITLLQSQSCNMFFIKLQNVFAVQS